MNKRRIVSALLLCVTSVAFLAVDPTVAGAEYDSNRQTDWGVSDQGASNTIAQWDALTWAVDQMGGTIFVGGNYLNVTDGSKIESQPYLSAFDADTGDWQSWFRPQVGNAVFALAPSPDGGLFVGGEMDTWNGETLGGLVKIDPATGELWPGWQSRVYGGSSVVRDLKIESDGKLYVVGGFTTATQGNGPIPVAGAIRVDPISGAIDTSWIPLAEDGTIWGVSRSATQNVTYLAGFFGNINALEDTKGFAGVDDTGAVVQDRSIVPYNACTTVAYCSQLYDVEATEYGHIWVAGVEHSLYVLNESDGSMVVHHYTGCDPSRNATCLPRNWYGGEFQEIERAGDRVYATCHCWYDLFSDTTEVIRHTRPNENENVVHSTTDALIGFDAATGAHDPAFRPYLTGDAGGFGMHVNPSDGCLWAVGGFDSYGAPGGPQPPARDLVRICDETGPGPAALPAPIVPAPADCGTATEEVDGATTATLTWTLPAGASRGVVERSIDGGPWNWRGSIGGNLAQTLTEQPVANSVTSYRVLAVFVAGQRSATAACAPDIDLRPNLTAPTACLGNLTAANQVDLTWDAGNDATDYVIRRSVNGGNLYWRGRVTDLAFTGSVLDLNKTYSYVIVARDANGVEAEPTSCGDFQLTPPEVLAPATCSAVLGDGDIAELTWDPSVDATGYIIRRAVNGGTYYWRGRINDGAASNFDGAALALGKTYVYTVEALKPDGATTDATTCSPSLELTSPEVLPVSECSAIAPVGDPGSEQAVVTFGVSENAVSYVIRRSVGGGTSYWRGRIDAVGAAGQFELFSDPISQGVTYTYTVEAVRPDGSKTDATSCGDVLWPNDQVLPVASCTGAVDAAGSVTINYVLQAGAVEPAAFVVSRSANGGPFYWRGKFSPGLFTDTISDARTYTYRVVSQSAAGANSDPVVCAPDLVVP